MAEELITDLIDEPRISKQLADTIEGLGVVKSKILEINNLSQGISLGENGAENFRKAKTAAEQLAAAELKLSQANSDLGKALAQTRLQTELTNKSNKEASRESLGLVDAYKKLSNQFVAAARAAKNLAAVDIAKGLKEFSKETKEALTYANGLNDQLKSIDAGVGQYQRNVGNYSSATNALNQVLREAPSLAINFQTFALAISNNLPVLFDEFSKLSKAIDENTGRVNGASNALKQLGASLFSAGSILTIGITLFTLYSKEISTFFSNLFKTKKEIDATAESQRILNEALKDGTTDYADAVTEVEQLKININLAKKGFLDKEKVVRQYNESIGKTIGQVKTLDKVEQALVKHADDYIKFQLLKAAANIALSDAAKTAVEAAKIEQRAIEDLASSFDLAGARDAVANGTMSWEQYEATVKESGEKKKQALLAEQKKLQDTQTKIAADFQKQAADIAKKAGFDFFGGEQDDKKAAKNKAAAEKTLQERKKAILETQRFELEAQAKTQQAIFENEKKGYEERANALTAFTLLQNGIARTNQRIAEVDAEGSQEKIGASRAAFNKKYTENEIAHNKELLDITKDYLDEESSILINGNKRRQDQISQQEAEERKRTLDLFRTGKIDTEQYEAERLRIENKYDILRLQAEAETVKKILDLRKLKSEDVKKIEEDLFDITSKIRELDVKYQEQAELAKVRAAQKAAKEQEKITRDQTKEAKKSYTELSRQIQAAFRQIGELASPILDIISNRFEKQKNAIQEQIDLIGQKEKTEIEAINNSTASEQEKADKIAVVQARAESQRRALEAERRRVQQEQARFDKAKAIFDIVANTAVNVVKFLGVPILAALAAAVGAAQLAAVASRPIPKYKGGRKGGPAEFAYVGDGGVSEVVEHEGRMWVTPRRPTLTYLPAGATVHKSMSDFLQDHGGSTMPSITTIGHGDQYGAAMVREMKKGNTRIVEAIRNNRPSLYEPMTREEMQGMVSSVMNNFSKIEKYKR